MEVTRLYLDANILIYLGEGAGEITRLLADVIDLKRAPSILCTSELSLSEVLVYPYRHRSSQDVAKYEGWLTAGMFMGVVSVSRAVLQNAAQLRAHHTSLKLPDAIHLATAAAEGCSHFLTADRRLQSLPGDLPSSRTGLERLTIVAPSAAFLRSFIESQI